MGLHPFLRHQCAFYVTILASDELTRLGGNDTSISSTGYIVRAESTKEPGWYRLAAAFDESPSGDELAWQKLVAAFFKKS